MSPVSGAADRRSGRGGRIAAAVFVGAALVAVAVLLLRQSTTVAELAEQAREYNWSLEWEWLAGALALATLNLCGMAALWTRLFRGVGGDLERGEAWRAWLVTNLGRYMPGKIWQLAGLAAYARRKASSGGAALSAALVFQIVVLATGTGVALGTVGGQALGLEGRWVAAAGVAAALTMIALVAQPRAVSAGARIAGRWLRERTHANVPPRREMIVAGVGLCVAWGVYGAGLWALLRGMGVAGVVPPLTATGIFAGSYIVGYLAFVVPGGLGVREGAMTGLLAAATPLPVAPAAVVAVAARLWVTVSELLAVAAAGMLAGAAGWGHRGERDRETEGR